MHHPITLPKAYSNDGQVVLIWYKAAQRFKDDKQTDNPSAPCAVKIYRRQETDFLRDDDYHEYFMGKALDNPYTKYGDNSEEVELIFDGELEPENDRKFTYIDKQAKYRTTYSYFISLDSAPAVGPVPLRHIDPEIYWSTNRLFEELKAIESSAPNNINITLDSCGATGGGEDILRLRMGHSGPRLVLVGLIHPGESGPELIVPALRALLKRAPKLFDKVQVMALPAVNVDGRKLQAQGTPWYIRKTIGGTDLNRNFPANWDEPALGYGLDSRDPDAATYRGSAPGSAPETQAVMAALREDPPDVLLSCHALASLCSLPALYPVAAKGEGAYEERCGRLIKAFASGLFPEHDYQESWARPGTSQGSLGAWVYQEFKAPAFDLEMGAVDKDEVELAKRDLTTRQMLYNYQQKHTQGLNALLNLLAKEAL